MNTPKEQPVELELIEQSTEETDAAAEMNTKDILSISDEIAKKEEEAMNQMEMPGEIAA